MFRWQVVSLINFNFTLVKCSIDVKFYFRTLITNKTLDCLWKDDAHIFFRKSADIKKLVPWPVGVEASTYACIYLRREY